eukprot:CAMPEP_0206493776 /NCGR_PEP_ID=MMETSP0324_2-20121206/47238_1 /ASSEMBLY_ACC=CAM_ASM_000836 /TAXON_ID=2866 /ORGANISM="Crypthecodinium cohnii, Strain Seligo" /LENGTH=254 /DNA_ID=CAMNT_0053977113 /DNA_START=212 /DNA_END=973 /DNA_ORIENTATION=-
MVSGGGLLGRFENVRQKKSCKRIVPCEAATSEYLRSDYLKPQHLPLDRIDHEANYSASSNINETRFHKGFHRKHRADIQSEAPRLEAEFYRDMARDQRVQMQIDRAREMKEKVTFNILTGEGVGRESEFKQIGKKLLNPGGRMEDLFGDPHAKEAQNRLRASKHRFFESPAPEKETRTAHLFHEGLTSTSRESAVLGYGNGGKRRTRVQSCGTSDNYATSGNCPQSQVGKRLTTEIEAKSSWGDVRVATRSEHV